MFETLKSWLTPRSRKARQATQTLKANAEKALRMKQEAGPQTHIPEHRTAHEGGVGGPQVGATDTAVSKEPTNTPNLSRSHGARVGDTGKTTGPGR
jgi:hypothetical protein